MIIIHYIGFQLVKLLSLVDFFIEPNCSALLDDFLKIVEIDRLRTIYISFHIYSFIYIYIYIYSGKHNPIANRIYYVPNVNRLPNHITNPARIVYTVEIILGAICDD